MALIGSKELVRAFLFWWYMAYTQQKIAEALADLMLGMSQEKVAQKHGVARNSVQKWSKNVQIKKPDIGDLVEEHLRNELETLSVIAEHTKDKEWLGKQSANDVAVLYGVMSDKAHAKLAALERAQREHQRQAE